MTQAGATVTVAVAGLCALAIYAVFGGADFGGGVWDLLATGPRAADQRKAVASAIGPVWEANHVWLIFLIVLLFTCFPSAFSTLSVALYLPLTFVMIGIVFRGVAFVFRAHAHRAANTSLVWGRIFGIASTITPFFFGTSAGAVATGAIAPDALSAAWFQPFSLATGGLAVAVCAQVAAVFLTVETADPDVRGDFRARALIATLVAAGIGALALAVAFLMKGPATFAQLTTGRGLIGVGTAMALGLTVLSALLLRRYAFARAAAVAEVVAVLLGWYAAQAPYLIPGRLTIFDGAAPESTLTAFLVVVACGAAVLVPSLWFLFAVFKGRNPALDA